MSCAPNVQIQLTFQNEENGQSELLTTNSMPSGDWKILSKNHIQMAVIIPFKFNALNVII